MAKVLVNFQDEFLQEIDKIAEVEHRTRSSLIREALRRYISQYNHQQKENDNQAKTLIQNTKSIIPIQKAS